MKKKNIFVIIIDSLRSDKFIGSSKTSHTPNIDKLIENGIYFCNTVSPSDGTLFSWAGIFSGKYSFRTGINLGRFSKVDKKMTTLFHLLKKNGYDFYGHLPEVASKIGLFPNFKNENVFFNKYVNFEDGLGQQIINELSSNMKTPWCYILHSYDLHFPMKIPEKFDEIQYGKIKYERAVSSIDYWIGKFINCIDMKNTLLIITADHATHINEIEMDAETVNTEKIQMLDSIAPKIGRIIPEKLLPIKSKVFFALEKKRKKQKEKFVSKLNLKPHQLRQIIFQRGDVDKFLYDENIHVPLLIVDSKLTHGTKIDHLTRSIDISPTILDIINSEYKLENVDGVSLLPEINNKKSEERIGFIENTPLIQKKVNLTIGIRTSKFKYFRDRDDLTKRVHLFNLIEDKFEENNIAASRPDIVEKMEKFISKINYKNNSKSTTIDEKESKIIENELEKLGYD